LTDDEDAVGAEPSKKTKLSSSDKVGALLVEIRCDVLMIEDDAAKVVLPEEAVRDDIRYDRVEDDVRSGNVSQASRPSGWRLTFYILWSGITTSHEERPQESVPLSQLHYGPST
jgi:hypothetical protein